MSDLSTKKSPAQELVSTLIKALDSEEKRYFEDDARKLADMGCCSDMGIASLLLLLMRECRTSTAGVGRLSPSKGAAEFFVMREGRDHLILEIPKSIYQALLELITTLSELDKNLSQTPSKGQFFLTALNRDWDLLIHSFPSLFGASLRMQLRPHDDQIRELDSIGLSETDLLRYLGILKSRSGLIVVTGPKGSGKSGFIYATLKHLRHSRSCIMTAEEPVRKVLSGICQSNLNPDSNYDGVAALRAMRLHGADVIYLSSLSDAALAHEMSKTVTAGRLFFTTFHSRNALVALKSLRDLCQSDEAVADFLKVIISTRIVRLNCPNCQEEYTPDENLLFLYGMEEGSLNFRRGKGCDQCDNTGFKGEAFLYEMLHPDDAMRRAIREGLEDEELIRTAESSGFCTFFDSAQFLFFEGTLTIEEFHESMKNL